ncbi:MAG: peptidylprolyl isomerase [Azospirillaceae bacterium]
MTIEVNGVAIPDRDVAAEVQNHPAEDFGEAESAAVRALVVRELLVQEADRLGIEAEPADLGDGRWETGTDARIRVLLEREVTTPEADEAACRRYYDNNPARFTSPTLYEAAHIFFPAEPQDAEATATATASAERAIATLQADPGAFARLAGELSACSSAKEGGRLGQVSRGQTLPEFETFLDALEPGQICPVPVKTRYGVHVVRLDHRAEGSLLPFEAVRGRIAEYLAERAWRRAVAQYVSILAGRAEIAGADIGGATSPLVQ